MKPAARRTASKRTRRSPRARPVAVTKDILIGDLIQRYPQSGAVLLHYGFHCIGCMVSPYESLEAGAAVHGVPLVPLLKDLNRLIQKK